MRIIGQYERAVLQRIAARAALKVKRLLALCRLHCGDLILNHGTHLRPEKQDAYPIITKTIPPMRPLMRLVERIRTFIVCGINSMLTTGDDWLPSCHTGSRISQIGVMRIYRRRHPLADGMT
jgi:hypothetical protein